MLGSVAKETKMAEAKQKSVDQKIRAASNPVPAKTTEVSDAEMEKVVGGAGEEVTFEYGALQVRYVQQD
jgi:hypothetical protein